MQPAVSHTVLPGRYACPRTLGVGTSPVDATGAEINLTALNVTYDSLLSLRLTPFWARGTDGSAGGVPGDSGGAGTRDEGARELAGLRRAWRPPPLLQVLHLCLHRTFHASKSNSLSGK